MNRHCLRVEWFLACLRGGCGVEQYRAGLPKVPPPAPASTLGCLPYRHQHVGNNTAHTLQAYIPSLHNTQQRPWPLGQNRSPDSALFLGH